MSYTFLVIGDKCLDVFVYGEVKRLSPEAPVPVFNPIHRKKNDGMAKNVYNNLFSLIGKELANHEIYGVFSEEGSVKTRYVEYKSNHSFLRVDENDNCSAISFSKYNKGIIAKADCIIISDYNKGFLSKRDIINICQFKKENALVFLDSKKKINEEIVNLVDFIKFNKEEATLNEDIWRSFTEKVIVTSGSHGAYFNNQHFPTQEKLTIDVSGAGDTFLAALAYYYTTGKDIYSAINKANKCALEVVSQRGVSVV
jgi:D-beta-D-heptose 7-phosphate kinase/D-beta-D-heptose 1-phosphate adenosyltransferase